MLTVSDALDRIQAAITPLDSVTVPLGESLGMTLAEDVVSSCDSPPFDKSLMDGYAVRSADVQFDQLTVIELITAGQVPTKPVGSGEATQIMTGAPLPDGVDAVVKIEDTERHDQFVSVRTKFQAPTSFGAELRSKRAIES
jgi:molybdopterin molybdotransferase